MGLPDLISSVLPAVTHIDVRSPQGPSNGSGFAIPSHDRDRKKSIIVTNAHVVDEATSITVRFYDDRRFKAKVR